MFEQTFAISDLFKLVTLTFIELALSADNAIVLGFLTRRLEQPLRKKALFVGVVSSVLLRALAILMVAFLLSFYWIQLVGAIYLIYLSVQYFAKRRREKTIPESIPSFWKTVLLIECLDLIFAIDSIVAGVAFIGPTEMTINPKLWIVYFGGVIGLLITRFAAHWFSILIDQFPRLGISAHLLIGWVGIELAVNALPWPVPYFAPIFWIGVVALLAAGFVGKKPRC